MLKLLNISNLAVVDNLKIEFGLGLNVLSGETGSGKSIIIDALGVLSGNRVTSDVIRTGLERAYVEGVFDVAGNTPLIELLTNAGITIDDDEIVIKREISLNGRGRIFVNNQSATVTLLKQIQPHIIDIHGQGDQQSLLSAENHLRMYDAFIGATQLRQKVEQKYEGILNALNELESSQRSEAERLQLLDLLEYQINEIRRASLTQNEDVELERERHILANAERLVSASNEVYELLYDNEQAVVSLLSVVQKRLDELAGVDPSLDNYRDQIANVKYIIEDIALYLRAYGESVDVSPERLKWIDARLGEIDKLKRKYGQSVDAIVQSLIVFEGRAESLKEADQQLANRLKVIDRSLLEGEKDADALSQLRRAKSISFQDLAHNEMADVALENSRFRVEFGTPNLASLRERLSMFSADLSLRPSFHRFGKESVEFYFSANFGEDLRPVSEVASGGELSRLMLVLKSIIAPTQFPRTLIFDEIDTGIGGRVADAVGFRLKKLAKANQVLCVTHQAQIARYADTHFLVSKETKENRTVTIIRVLDQGGRVNELARMLAGNEITNTAKKHARELLKY